MYHIKWKICWAFGGSERSFQVKKGQSKNLISPISQDSSLDKSHSSYVDIPHLITRTLAFWSQSSFGINRGLIVKTLYPISQREKLGEISYLHDGTVYLIEYKNPSFSSEGQKSLKVNMDQTVKFLLTR